MKLNYFLSRFWVCYAWLGFIGTWEADGWSAEAYQSDDGLGHGSSGLSVWGVAITLPVTSSWLKCFYHPSGEPGWMLWSKQTSTVVSRGRWFLFSRF